MRVALVHDWLTNQGGGERVLWAMHQAYPDAVIYTSVFDPEGMPDFKPLDVRTSFLQNWPLAKRRHQLFPLLRKTAFEAFDFSGYDLVVSSCSAEAKGVITKPETVHISYLHTPTRYYWSDYANYYRAPGFGPLNPLVRLAMPTLVGKMREWDYAAAQRPELLLANSSYVSRRIAKYYRRESEVLHPPIDLERFEVNSGHREGYLVMGRQIPYKRTDLAVKACRELGVPLTVAGDGSELTSLKQMAGPKTQFLGRVSDREVTELYRSHKALLFPPEEDFGLTPLEAQATGTPVIAFGKGGALETVVEGETGLFFKEQTVESLKDAIQRFEEGSYDPAKCRRQAEEFGQERFIDKLRDIADRELALKRSRYIKEAA